MSNTFYMPSNSRTLEASPPGLSYEGLKSSYDPGPSPPMKLKPRYLRSDTLHGFRQLDLTGLRLDSFPREDSTPKVFRHPVVYPCNWIISRARNSEIMFWSYKTSPSFNGSVGRELQYFDVTIHSNLTNQKPYID
jgi:hypothetical protein